MAARATHARREKSELEVIPGVGPSIAQDLISMGITRVEELKGRSPEAMYDQLCELTNARQDRCMLYVFRCAVYFASNPRRHPEKLKWWNWMDDSPATRQSRR